jgi:hypothetical protein
MASPRTDDVEQLLQLLTLEEKVSLLAGADTWQTNEISRLGIGSLKVTTPAEMCLVHRLTVIRQLMVPPELEVSSRSTVLPLRSSLGRSPKQQHGPSNSFDLSVVYFARRPGRRRHRFYLHQLSVSRETPLAAATLRASARIPF